MLSEVLENYDLLLDRYGLSCTLVFLLVRNFYGVLFFRLTFFLGPVNGALATAFNNGSTFIVRPLIVLNIGDPEDFVRFVVVHLTLSLDVLRVSPQLFDILRRGFAAFLFDEVSEVLVFFSKKRNFFYKFFFTQ